MKFTITSLALVLPAFSAPIAYLGQAETSPGALDAAPDLVGSISTVGNQKQGPDVCDFLGRDTSDVHRRELCYLLKRGTGAGDEKDHSHKQGKEDDALIKVDINAGTTADIGSRSLHKRHDGHEGGNIKHKDEKDNNLINAGLKLNVDPDNKLSELYKRHGGNEGEKSEYVGGKDNDLVAVDLKLGANNGLGDLGTQEKKSQWHEGDEHEKEEGGALANVKINLGAEDKDDSSGKPSYEHVNEGYSSVQESRRDTIKRAPFEAGTEANASVNRNE
ncbi:unnamed protein product [Periconia digitata]|uniref:Uncharacterized protein n=1 Tax=Periconia digitata TaxID=1303443 RepID=A0A9W4UEL1_9PLEO|nr:unnamed protein product [Periconia digitata]